MLENIFISQQGGLTMFDYLLGEFMVCIVVIKTPFLNFIDGK